MTAPAPKHPQIEVYEALRDVIRTRLNLGKYDVGGWEVQPNTKVSVAVYGYQGEFNERGGARSTGSQDSLAVQVNLRGTQAVSEQEMYPLRDALKYLIESFSHPLLAGIKVKGWTFEIVGTGKFDNMLTLTGTIGFQTRAHHFSEDELIGRAVQVILQHTEQVPLTTPLEDTP